METCGILLRRDTRNEDEHGCIKPDGHNDAHIFKSKSGSYIEWEDDYGCGCGCWDEYDKGDPDVCYTYKELKNYKPSPPNPLINNIKN